ncbi:uncharacterized protein EDB93DRAFT_1155193 [Suillus bovinus]|uniref:uncharacterized protein n=1 Tax=Suillus bovinus TaxID=48563 RepID=UPI001B8680FD|nr:uncharacterized protein EDB93DRAFT_1155193 [Suillus bovinus]KAG2143487.1 hypothetical protein EDB93DRAFT_1155193 [Suillus bovinus]
MMFTKVNRKFLFKSPPTVFTDKLISQEARRSKALEEQKRRRAQKFESSRQLDAFADLNLGNSDDDGDLEDEPEIIREGVSGFVQMVSQPVETLSLSSDAHNHETLHSGKRRGKSRRKRIKAKPSKWADKCMYAELLEMNEEAHLWDNQSADMVDGLPRDLEAAWVAVAPVPTGKRCLAVTQHSAGIVGTSPNTTLRSRVLGKMLLPRFPSSLPPLTVLDCILDVNWKDNGIIHVLDVLKWKGQDVGDCETPFRFWWRDTRLAELPKHPLPSGNFSFTAPYTTSDTSSQNAGSLSNIPPSERERYRFPYPTSFVPIPYHTDTTLTSLSSFIIPMARSTREISVDIPMHVSPPDFTSYDMAVDDIHGPIVSRSTTSVIARVDSDGLLLYVSHASYEEGTSPLSCWIPNKAISECPELLGSYEGHDSPLDVFQRLVQRRTTKNLHVVLGSQDPMDI